MKNKRVELKKQGAQKLLLAAPLKTLARRDGKDALPTFSHGVPPLQIPTPLAQHPSPMSGGDFSRSADALLNKFLATEAEEKKTTKNSINNNNIDPFDYPPIKNNDDYIEILLQSNDFSGNINIDDIHNFTESQIEENIIARFGGDTIGSLPSFEEMLNPIQSIHNNANNNASVARQPDQRTPLNPDLNLLDGWLPSEADNEPIQIETLEIQHCYTVFMPADPVSSNTNASVATSPLMPGGQASQKADKTE